MPYVGNPLADAFSSRVKQDLTGQSGTSFTLTHAVSHANDLSVYINHVRQEPTTAYSVNGTTLTTTGSVAGTDDFYIIYDELALQSISHPSDQAMTATSGTFTSGLVGTTGTFSGAVSGTNGTFSGNVSGTLTTAAQPNITSVGTLTNFTSTGIDDNADANAITIDSSENVALSGGMYVSNTLSTLLVDRGGIDRSGNTTRIISGRAGGNYADFSINIAGVGGVNRQVYIDYQGNMTLDNGNLKIGTSGKGIDFSAQTGTNAVATGDGTENPTTESEVLKHYEHGYFYPKVVSSGATFDYQHTGNQYGSGHYTRIGDIVFVDMNFDSDGGISGTTSNPLQIHNMPFNNNTGTSLNCLYFYKRVSSSSYPFQMCSIYNTQIGFMRSPTSGQWQDLPASDVNFSDHRMKITGCYHIG